MLLSDLTQGASYIRKDQIRPGYKVWLRRHARDGVVRDYFGDVISIRRPNAFILEMQVENFFEDGVEKLRFKKQIAFRLGKDIRVQLLKISSAKQDAQAEQRKAYAKARFQFRNAKVAQHDAFSLLGVTPNLPIAEFMKVKKKVMLKWHPDRVLASGLAEDIFISESKKYTDAISFVESFLKNRYARLNN